MVPELQYKRVVLVRRTGRNMILPVGLLGALTHADLREKRSHQK